MAGYDIPVGSRGCISAIVDEASTAAALGSGDVGVLGTPRVVALVEAAAVAAIAGRLSGEDTTVGTHVAIDHLLPTPVGGTVEASAVVTEVVGRRIVFDVEVIEGETIVARGTHQRVVVDRSRFPAIS